MKALNYDFRPPDFLELVRGNSTSRVYPKDRNIFLQGDRAQSMFYLQSGKVKLAAASLHKEAVIAILGPGFFFGEGCLAGQTTRATTATTMSESCVTEVHKDVVSGLLRSRPDFAEMFIAHMLLRNIRVEDDLADQISNSSEKRLARTLLLLANFEKTGRIEQIIPKMSQETLAKMVGTTRSRVSHFMNKFRKLGFIDYGGEILVRESLVQIVLGD